MAQTSEQRAVRRAMEGAWKQAGQAAAGMEQAIAAALTRVSSAAGQAAAAAQSLPAAADKSLGAAKFDELNILNTKTSTSSKSSSSSKKSSSSSSKGSSKGDYWQNIQQTTVVEEQLAAQQSQWWQQTVQRVADAMNRICSLVMTGWQQLGGWLSQVWQGGSAQLGGIWTQLYQTLLKPVWDNLCAMVDWLWEGHLLPLWERLGQLAGAVGELLNTLWQNILAPFVETMVGLFGQPIANLLQFITDRFGSLAAFAADVLSALAQSLQGICEFLTGVFTGNWEKAWQGILNVFNGVWSGMTATVRLVVNGVIDLVNAMVRGVAGGINAVVGAVNSIHLDIPEWVPGIGGNSIGFSIPTIPVPQIPRLAQGGYVGPGNPRLAVIGDNPTEGEIVAPESKLAAAVARGMEGLRTQEILAMLGQTVQLLQALVEKDESIYIGDEEIYRAAGRGSRKAGYPVGLNPAFR